MFAMVANRLVAPCSKRRLSEWAASDVVMPEGWSAPSLGQYYRAVDAAADAKEATEAHLYGRLCDLSNLDLRLVCYDLTSTYFEGSARPSDRFPSGRSGTRGTIAVTGPRSWSACCAPPMGSPSLITCSPGTPTTPPPCPLC